MLSGASLWTATQKPQGVFRSLRLLIVTLYSYNIFVGSPTASSRVAIQLVA
nr:MAG TPA: hypothetical protein [Caudoviricetes sp.]